MKKILTFFTAAAVLLITSCKKDDMGSMTVQVVDSGTDSGYDEVIIDVRRVEVKFANANTNNEFGKYFLDAHAGEFDLAAARDSGSIEIANKKRMPIGALTEMRIVVGDENFIRVNGVKHNLIITNNPNSGLTFPLDMGVFAGQEAEIILNIDLAGSVVQTGGNYTLNPLIVVE